MEFIHLNVGGVYYTTTKETLISGSGYFSAMLSKHMEPGQLLDGGIFIDRNGDLFAHVLNYLRNRSNWSAPNDPKLILDLINEAEFFCVTGMLEKIKQRVPPKKVNFNIVFHSDKGLRRIGVVNAPQIICKNVEFMTDTPVKSNHNVICYYKLNDNIFSIDDYYQYVISDYILLRNNLESDDGYYEYTFVDKFTDPIYEEIRERLY